LPILLAPTFDNRYMNAQWPKRKFNHDWHIPEELIEFPNCRNYFQIEIWRIAFRASLRRF